MDEIRLRFGLSKTESKSVEDAIWRELKNPANQKWFKGSNNRLHRVINALQAKRTARGLSSLKMETLLHEVNALLRKAMDSSQ